MKFGASNFIPTAVPRRLPSSKPDLIIERSRLIPALAREAQASGAKLSFDTRFLGMGPNSSGLRLETETGGRKEELHAASVVGADGATSRVARTGWLAAH